MTNFDNFITKCGRTNMLLYPALCTRGLFSLATRRYDRQILNRNWKPRVKPSGTHRNSGKLHPCLVHVQPVPTVTKNCKTLAGLTCIAVSCNSTRLMLQEKIPSFRFDIHFHLNSVTLDERNSLVQPKTWARKITILRFFLDT